MKFIFELTENLSLGLTKLDTELGLDQPQLVSSSFIMIVIQSNNFNWKIVVELKPKAVSRGINFRNHAPGHKYPLRVTLLEL